MQTLDSGLDLVQVNSCDEDLAITFVPTNYEIYRILQVYPNLKEIYVEPCVFEKMPCAGQTLLYMQKVNVIVDDPSIERLSEKGDAALAIVRTN